ncbi:terminase gpA endonuclease subunit [Oceaniovalibus sp. ACAM 378]|uniref:terminase gpA endonuclease subunit n=1 Tax=Oceaniovalibus sp. ACAM 378 TaxID=2599923 RepID=UPI00351B0AA7
MKRDLNTAGQWYHETETGDVATLDSGRVRRADLLSYWLDGAAASFSSWAELVTQYRNALRQFELTGDEEALKTTFNTGQAQPYQPRGMTSELELTLQGLKDKAEGNSTAKGTAPAWTRYITVSVDVQGTRFAVGVTAWGEDGRHQPIDRFDIVSPPPDAPGAQDRALNPFSIAEDWAVLEPLGLRTWPVEGGEWELRPVALCVDQQGGGATTDNAYAFYRARRRAGDGRRWFLSRGRGGLNHTDRIWLKAPESASGRRRVAKDIKTLNMATDRLKDAVTTSLRLIEEGQNHCGVPEWMSEGELIEFTAERRGAKGWEKRPGMVRNESLDHLVMARALHIQIGGEKIVWERPHDWARLEEDNTFAVHIGPAPAPQIESETTPTPAPVHSTARRTARGNDWIKPRENWL